MNAAPGSDPAVSVLMSCYNAARWLGDAVESVLGQTFGAFEFIAVDDGSQDDTPAILQRYAASDRRMVVIRKPNTGLGDSLNAGISRARGAWIARLDADDLCEPDRLERQLRLAQSSGLLVFVGSGLTAIDAMGQVLGVHRYPARHRALLRQLHEQKPFPPHSSAFIRSAAVRAIGGYRTRIRRAQDWDLWLRLSEVGELACVQEPLVRVRRHPGQVTHEEAGRRQKLDARLSSTSYWLRQGGFPDPVAGSEAAFTEFSEWMESRLCAHGLYDVEALRASLRHRFHSAPNAVAGGLKVLGGSLEHPALALRLALQRVTGENLARRLAREWACRAPQRAL